MRNKIVKFLILMSVFSVFINTGDVKACQTINNTVIDIETTDPTTESVTPTEETPTEETPTGEASTEATTENTDFDEWATEEVKDITEELIPTVDTKNFFERLYNKGLTGMNAFQKGAAIILAIFFIIDLVMIAVCAFGKKQGVAWYIFVLFLIAILFTCDIYAVEIIAAFNNWFVS